MPARPRMPSCHSGRTDAGHTRDVKVERIGPVTISKRGLSYSLYFRERGSSRRVKVDGYLAGACATTRKVAASLAERRPGVHQPRAVARAAHPGPLPRGSRPVSRILP